MANDGSGGTQPFDPNVPTAPAGGYSTNLVANSVAQAQQEPGVFLGWHHGYADDVRGSGTKPPRYKVTRTPSQLIDQFYDLDREEFLHLRNLYAAAGLVSPDADPSAVRDAYIDVINQVGPMQDRGVTLSPMGYIKNLIRMNGLDPSEIGSEEDYDPTGTSKDPNRTETFTQRNISEIDEGEAWSSLQNTLSSMLGRDPSDQETRDFTYRMGQLAARTPSVSKVVSQYKDGDEVSRTTHTTPGFTASDMAHEAYDSAQNDPGYAEYSAASTYFNAAMSALGPLGG